MSQGRPWARSVDSESVELGYRASRCAVRGSPRSCYMRGPCCCTLTGLVHQSRRSPRPERAGNRVLQEPGRPARLQRTCRPGSADPKLPGPRPGVPGRWERMTGRSAGTAQTNPISRAEGMGRSRSAFTVPMKRGNCSRLEPRGGKEGVESSNRWRETCRRHRTPIPCSRNDSG